MTKPTRYGFQVLRRDREDGTIEYQIFADTKGHGTQVAYVQSTKHDAEFIAACLAQAPLFAQLLQTASPSAEGATPDPVPLPSPYVGDPVPAFRAPCAACVSEIGRVDPNCEHCHGTGVCPSEQPDPLSAVPAKET